MVQPQPHFLLITFPAQGHLNPTLQLAKRLTSIGVRVTFLINTFIRRRMTHVPNYHGFTISEFSDGYDDGHKVDEAVKFFSEFRRHATQALTQIITSNSNKSQPVTCLVYGLFVSWAADVARKFHVQPTLFWIQPAIVFDIYYYYFHSRDEKHKISSTHDNNDDNDNDTDDDDTDDDIKWFEETMKFPNLPLSFTNRDLPSFITPTNAHKFATSELQQHMQVLAKETRPKVLVNTFDALEPDALLAIRDVVDLIGIGPMIPLENSTTVINLFKPSEHKYIEWLNTKEKSSVVYISFGSMSVLSDKQVAEIKSGLLKSGRQALWVMRAPQNGAGGDEGGMEDGNMIVSWCNQTEVLSHASVGCFLTHCGWNSTLESIIAGTPMVAFPQWSDQGTNAMLVEESWRNGVRVNVNKEKDLVCGDEIKRCLEMVMDGGERGEEIRRNALKLKGLAIEASSENGSSRNNLKTFVEEIASTSFY